MARRRRPGSRTSVEDARAEIIVPSGSVLDAEGTPMPFAAIAKRLHRVTSFPIKPGLASSSVAVTLDRFAWDLHLADVGVASDTHDGDEFFDAATSVGWVAVFVVDGVDPRRSQSADIAEAARCGHLVGARVGAYPVATLQS